jgi:hypothetical protein
VRTIPLLTYLGSMAESSSQLSQHTRRVFLLSESKLRVLSRLKHVQFRLCTTYYCKRTGGCMRWQEEVRESHSTYLFMCTTYHTTHMSTTVGLSYSHQSRSRVRGVEEQLHLQCCAIGGTIRWKRETHACSSHQSLIEQLQELREPGTHRDPYDTVDRDDRHVKWSLLYRLAVKIQCPT